MLPIIRALDGAKLFQDVTVSLVSFFSLVCFTSWVELMQAAVTAPSGHDVRSSLVFLGFRSSLSLHSLLVLRLLFFLNLHEDILLLPTIQNAIGLSSPSDIIGCEQVESSGFRSRLTESIALVTTSDHRGEAQIDKTFL